MRVFCENVNTRPPLDYMYSDIAECSGLQMPDYEKNINRTWKDQSCH